jgi:hypothetical protein
LCGQIRLGRRTGGSTVAGTTPAGFSRGTRQRAGCPGLEAAQFLARNEAAVGRNLRG